MVAEAGELGDEAVAAAVGVVAAGEVVPAEVAVDLTGGRHDVVGAIRILWPTATAAFLRRLAVARGRRLITGNGRR